MLMIKQSQRPKRRASRPHVVPPQKAWNLLTEFLNLLGVNGPFPRTMSPMEAPLPPTTLSEESFSRSYLAAEILSKFDDGKSSDQKASEAWRRFHAAEDRCALTNREMEARTRVPFFGYASGQQRMYDAGRKIARLLGDFSWDEAEQYFGWGPGATTRAKRRQSHAAYKYSGRPDTTFGNTALANACIMRSPLWQEGLEFEEDSGYCNIVAGNRIVTVPKNWKTYRTIAIEPCMNIYVQKGIGRMIRKRLRRVGIDLDDQTRNQHLAAIGSERGWYATIDLSMASDTIAKAVVADLLPPDWLLALGQCRSPKGVLPSGEVINYQKFSSMGNGYTFELESLIFWALVESVIDSSTPEPVPPASVFSGDELLDEPAGTPKQDLRCNQVYGDDLIVHVSLAEEVMRTLSFAGFTPNEKKTHITGRFRESCGKHYLGGYDVTPFYVKKPVDTLPALFLLHNQIYRWCKRMAWDSTLPRAEIRDLLARMRALAPASWRKPRIPDGLGDGAFIGTFDEVCPRRASHWLEGFEVRHLANVPKKEACDLKGYLLYALDRVKGPRYVSRDDWQIEDSPGGVLSRTPRMREVKTLIAQFPGYDPFAG